MKLIIELYEEYPCYYAHIGEDCTSGYLCSGNTPEECAEQVEQYIIDTFYREEDETN